jgi:hypothetical protein
MLAAKQQRYEAPRRQHAEEQAARWQKEAQRLWRRAQRERRRAVFFWGETRREQRRAEAAWRRVLTGVDPVAPKLRISAADRDRLVKILGMLAPTIRAKSRARLVTPRRYGASSGCRGMSCWRRPAQVLSGATLRLAERLSPLFVAGDRRQARPAILFDPQDHSVCL